MKSDFSFRWELWRCQKRNEFLIKVTERLIVAEEGFVDFRESLGEGLGEEDSSHLDKGFNKSDAHFNCLWTVENIGDHQGSVFGKGPRSHMRESKGFKVVTICDHLCFLTRGNLKSEIRRESVRIPFYCLVECFGCHPVELGEVTIKDNLVTSDGVNVLGYLRERG